MNMRFPALFSAILLSGFAASLNAAVIIEDDFSNGNPVTGGTFNPANQWYGSGVESNSLLTVTTAASSSQYSQSLFETGVSPALNIFNSTVSISVRDFATSGTGVNATSGQNFRIGLLSRDVYSATSGTIAFYGSGNDGISLSLNNAKSFSLQYKGDSATANTDPNIAPTSITMGAASGTVTSGTTITGFDMSLSATNWAFTLYLSNGSTSLNAGTWNLTPFANTWGNATDGFGNSALVMYAQNGTLGAGSSAFTIGSILVTPEPSKGLLILLGGMSILFTRRRKA